MKYTQDQIDRANRVNLVDWLKSQGESLEKAGRDHRWKRYDSVTIRENRWFRHSQNIGGYPIDFIMYFYGASFREAVEMLTGERPDTDGRLSPIKTETPPTEVEIEELRLPKPSDTTDKLMDYLGNTRKIKPSVIERFLASGDIYEDEIHHNVIFLGRDDNGVPRYAHAKGTGADSFKQDLKGSEKEYGFRCETDSKVLAVFEAPVDLMSFLSLMAEKPGAWENPNCIALGGVSEKALMKLIERRKDIEQIYLCLDSDEAGEEATKRIAKLLSEDVEVFRYKPNLKDWNEILVHLDEVEKPFFMGYRYQNPEAVPILKMSEVETQEVKWLWKPFIPFGKVTIVQGNPGEGKTTLALRLAAACTNHKLFPGMGDIEPFNVIYQTAEDGLGDTVKPRLLEAEADLSKVLVIDESDNGLSFSDDRIEKAIIQNRAKLLILDPIQAYVGEKTDMNRANEVRPLFRKLADIAERTGCAIVLIGHLNKASGGQTAYRGLGSIDFRAAARSVLLIGRVKKEPNVRVIIHDKSSLAPEGKPVAFSLGDEDGFEWIGEYEITADDLLAGRGGDTESKEDQARELILEMLEGGQRVFCDEIDKAADDMGISSRTVRKARTNLQAELGASYKTKRVGTRWQIWLEK